MKKPFIVIFGAVALCALAFFTVRNWGTGNPGGQKGIAEKKPAEENPNIRTIRNADGSRSEFVQTPDGRTMTKKNFDQSGAPSFSTVYRLDADRRPMGAKVYDPAKKELIKVSFGYQKSNGRLAEERIFDSQVKHVDPADGKEQPIYRVIHTAETPEKKAERLIITLIPTQLAFGGIYGDFLDPFKN